MWRYWTDFVLAPLALIAVIAVDARSLGFVALFAIGVIAWTFAEYWVHRTALHRWFWHGVHEDHHLRPADYVTAIWWYTPLLFAALFILLPAGLFAGFLAGYVAFLAIHHALHHVDLRERTWLHRYAIWHGRHHKLSDCNYGITVPVWDVLFGTSR
jgi:sterol desaturase/sphingolipid hydroxylase (fatty acid hydroxylase superfamily)